MSMDRHRLLFRIDGDVDDMPVDVDNGRKRCIAHRSGFVVVAAEDLLLQRRLMLGIRPIEKH